MIPIFVLFLISTLTSLSPESSLNNKILLKKEEKQKVIPFEKEMIQRMEQALKKMNAPHSFAEACRQPHSIFYQKTNIGFITRVIDNKELGPGKGGIRFLFKNDIEKSTWFQEQRESIEKNHILSLQEKKLKIEELIKNFIISDAKALAKGMTIKNSLQNIHLGGGKGVFALVKVTIEGEKIKIENAIKPTKEDLSMASRTYSRALTLNDKVGINIDIPAADQNTNSQTLAWMQDELIRVWLQKLLSSTPEQIAFLCIESPHTKELQELQLFLNKHKDSVEKMLLNYDPTQTPFIDLLLSLEPHTPYSALGVFTSKYPQKGGCFMRPESTGYGAFYVLDQYLQEKEVKETLNGKTALVQGIGAASQPFCELFTKEGGIIEVIGDIHMVLVLKDDIDRDNISEKIALFLKEYATYTNEYIAQSKPFSLKHFWTLHGKNFPFYEGFDVEKIKNQFFVQGIELNEFIFNQKQADILVPAAAEGQITKDILEKTTENAIVVEIANGGVCQEAQNTRFILPDSLTNSGGVVVSSFETRQALKDPFIQTFKTNLNGQHTSWQYENQAVLKELNTHMRQTFSDWFKEYRLQKEKDPSCSPYQTTDILAYKRIFETQKDKKSQTPYDQKQNEFVQKISQIKLNLSFMKKFGTLCLSSC